MVKIDISKDDLSLIKDALERVGKRELPTGELLKFCKEAFLYDKAKITERLAMFENEEIEEKEINKFEFHSDGYRTAIYVEFNEDNLLILGRNEDGEEINIMPIDDEGTRFRLVIRTRRGNVTIFLGLGWVNTLVEAAEKTPRLILSGGLQTKWKNVRTQLYDKVKDEDEEYYDFPNFTFNIWQATQIIRKGKNMELIEIIKQEIEEEE